MAFVQFAGFTFGKSASAYNTPWHGYPGNNSSYLVGGYDTVTGINNIQYSWQFGNGVSASIGIDDSGANNFNRTQIINAVGGAAVAPAAGAIASVGTVIGAAGGGVGWSGACTAAITAYGCAYGGTSVPDFVGNIRVDQAWGIFQVSGAIHDNHAAYFSEANSVPVGSLVSPGVSQVGAVNFGHPDDKYGGAVNVALNIKNIPTGAGDDIKVEGSWSLGASKYVLGTSASNPSSFDIYSGTKFAMGVTTDSIYSGASNNNGNPLTQQQLTRGWGFRGAFNHNWDPHWSTSLFGGIAGLSYNQTAKQLYCNTYVSNAGIAVRGGGVTNGGGSGGAFTAGSVCDPGFTISEIGLVTRWTPVKDLTFSVEALYAFLQTNMSGSANPISAASGATSGPSSALPLANTLYQFGNLGTASLNMRVQRNF
jgi:Porin subfamily